MKYNDLINTFFDELDNLDSIKEIKVLKIELLNNKELLKDLNNYHLMKTVTLKQKLYEYPLYVRYLSLEVNINLLIQDIKKKLDFTDRKCLHESN
ncbi:MAG: hypothetical protein ACI4WF_03410 [Bacilli bacterium]